LMEIYFLSRVYHIMSINAIENTKNDNLS